MLSRCIPAEILQAEFDLSVVAQDVRYLGLPQGDRLPLGPADHSPEFVAAEGRPPGCPWPVLPSACRFRAPWFWWRGCREWALYLSGGPPPQLAHARRRRTPSHAPVPVAPIGVRWTSGAATTYRTRPGLREREAAGRWNLYLIIAASTRLRPARPPSSSAACGLRRTRRGRAAPAPSRRPAPAGAMACTALQLRGRVVSRSVARTGAYMRALMVPRVAPALLACDWASAMAAVRTSSSATARSTMPAATASGPP